jgi:hypothetical protein
VRDGDFPTLLRAGISHCVRCYLHVPGLSDNVSPFEHGLLPDGYKPLPPTSNTSSMNAETGSEESYRGW